MPDAKELSGRRAAIVDALNKSIEIFSANSEDTFNEVITNGIRPIADAVGLDRVVFYKQVDIEGGKRLGQIYRWDKSEGGLMSIADELKILPALPVLEKWISGASKDSCVRLRESDYTEEVAAFLRVYGVKSILLKPIFTHGELWGAVTFQDHTNDRYFDEDCADLLFSAARIFSNAVIREETKRGAEKAVKALKQHDEMEAALNRAAIVFLSHKEESFESTMTVGVKEIADSLDLDRFAIYRNFPTPDVMRVSQIYRWDREAGGTTVPTKGLEDTTYAQFAPRWEELFAAGESINSPARLLPEADMLKAFGCVSVFLTPLFINNIFWGFALLEDRHSERYFEDDCVEMMRSAAFLCANTIIRTEMEHEINDANDFNSAILDASPMGFNVFDEDARIIDCNDVILQLFGTTKKYYLEHFFEFSPEYQSDGRNSAEKSVETIKRTLDGERVVMEWENITALGEIIPFEITLVCAAYKGRRVILEYKYDLRKTKKMTESIREQGEQIKVRLEQQELLSELSRGFISSGDSQTLVREAIAKLGRYHKVSLVFVFAIDYDKKDTYLAYHWTADGAPPRITVTNLYAFLTDNFDKKLLDCVALPIVACDDTAANPGPVFQELYSAGVMAVIGAPLYVDGHLWGVVCVEQSGAPRNWTTNEKDFVAMTTKTIAGIIMRDIYTRELEEAVKKATEASKAKSEFLSNMSHEMRTPLNAITGMTTIGKNAKDAERKDYALDKIQAASTHLLGVINDVLDMSKIEANMLELSPIEFDFEKMLQKTVAVINFRVDEKRQKLAVHIDSAIPKTLIADDQRLAQVVTNLLSNAVKFTPEEGSITLDANFMGEEKGVCTVQVSVTDTGIGISAEQQKRLFSSFQQAESSTTRKYGGTGLGLAISKSIVEMMGGRIWVQSEPAKGSTFAFVIQAQRGTAINEYPDAKGQQAENARMDDMVFPGRRILLAEDMEINREIIMALLEPTQVEIECAENGTQAVRMFADAPDRYDLIFMDVQMPEMDGYEATRRIRAIEAELRSASTASTFTSGETRGKGVPIIAMTANVFREDIEKCLEAGMDSHVGKPLNLDTVLEKLRTYLSGN